jgi:TatA/E family protein of Tat protein translocase
MDLLGIGGGEILLILVIVLLVFGPHKLPEIARTLGEAKRKMKETTTQLAKEMSEDMKDTQVVKKEISGLVREVAMPPPDDKSKPAQISQKADTT